MGLGSHPTTSFNLSYLHKGPVSKEGSLGIGASTNEFGGGTVQSIMTHERLLFSLLKRGNPDGTYYMDEP